MTMQNPTYGQPPMAPVPSRLSKSSLTSFILGILVCVPAAGLLAILFAIIGFVRTGNPMVRGRWMAIVGGILGTIATLMWALMGGGIVALVMGVMGLLAAPKEATNDFLRALAANDLPAMKAHSTGIDDDALRAVSETVREKGTFVDSTFTQQNMRNNTAQFEGTATFSKGTLPVKVRLIKDGETWKVDGIDLR